MERRMKEKASVYGSSLQVADVPTETQQQLNETSLLPLLLLPPLLTTRGLQVRLDPRCSTERPKVSHCLLCFSLSM